ncbi:MAG TPA: hypothetical protein VHH88_12810 [Verrucomicrobiae bacterium]|nr:hypothetical protein [Verrucomicrobiae bacterium]
MRPKIILGAMAAALIVLGISFALKGSRRGGSSAPVAALASTTPAAASLGNTHKSEKESAVAAVPSPIEARPTAGMENPASTPVATSTLAAATVTPTPGEEAIEQRKQQLMDLAMNNDEQSLNTILSEMTNSSKAIRQAALQAAIQFDDRSSIPRLKEIAGITSDPGEKQDIEDAIDYLNLPSIADYRASHPADPATVARIRERQAQLRAATAAAQAAQAGPGQPAALPSQ